MTLVFNIAFFLLCFFIVLKAADFAINFATRLAKVFQLSEFLISFFIVAVVSAMPETIISLLANIEGQQEVAVMALLGSNVIDLTLVFGVIAIFAGNIRVESKVMRKDTFYLILLTLPMLLGIDGAISRVEGIVLIIGGLLFMYTLSVEKSIFKNKVDRRNYAKIARLTVFLIASLLVMIWSADFTISFLSLVAKDLGVSTFFIALFIIGTGVCLPETLFSIRAIRSGHGELALGDILGTVIIDATIVLGVLALVNPIAIDPTMFRVIGFFNALGGCVLIYFIKVNKQLTRVEGIMLTAFYAAFIAVQIIMNNRIG